MLATALCLTETEIGQMSWDHYKALMKHWQNHPPAHFVLSSWLTAMTKRR